MPDLHWSMRKALAQATWLMYQGTGAEVATICRGQQIEEFNYQFQGGLYAQLINNPSFEELGDPITEWEIGQDRIIGRNTDQARPHPKPVC